MESTGIVRSRKHRSPEQWRALVDEWKASGQSRRQWCAEHGLSTESLRQWTKRLRGTSANVSLVEISRQPQNPSFTERWPLQVRISPRGEVELRGEFTEGLLCQVLRVAKEPTHVR
jgi:hypothetical protein